ncbi:lipopolysaccharide biosynthesis protein [Tenacibaculum sp. TC6]|uniref:lipopolysaccharide biosynthesis protein n=1 Tax=Tenacibaculum sp. TC6 TaxID=3423223 RepID=UPI003D361C85
MILSKLLKNNLLKDTLVYGLTNAMYTGLPLILLPFLVVVLEPKDYGMVDLFRTISMFLVPFLGLSTVQSIGRFYFDLDEDTFKKFVSSIQVFQFFTALVATVIVLLIAPWLGHDYTILLLLSISYFLFNQFCESLLVIFRVKQKAKKYLVIRVSSIIIELLILFTLFKVLNKLDWTFRVYPTVMAALLIGICCCIMFWRMGYRLFFSKKLLLQALVYSSPLILHMVSGYILNIGDRFFIKYFLTEEDLGNYAVAYQIGMAVNFFYTSFNLAWAPTYFKWMKENKISEINKVRKLIYISLPVFGGLALIGWLIFSSTFIKNSQYTISNQIIIIVLIANVILSLYKFESNLFLYTKETKRLSLFTFISAVVSIVFNLILIPKIGIMGAAITTLISFITIYLLVLFNKKKNEKIHQKFTF